MTPHHLEGYAAHMAGEQRFTHLSYDAAILSRDARQRRNAQPEPVSQVKSAATVRAETRARIDAMTANLAAYNARTTADMTGGEGR